MRVSEVQLQNLLNRPDVIASIKASGMKLSDSRQTQEVVDYMRSKLALAEQSVHISISSQAWDLYKKMSS